jgi:hypothetical protein
MGAQLNDRFLHNDENSNTLVVIVLYIVLYIYMTICMLCLNLSFIYLHSFSMLSRLLLDLFLLLLLSEGDYEVFTTWERCKPGRTIFLKLPCTQIPERTLRRYSNCYGLYYVCS